MHPDRKTLIVGATGQVGAAMQAYWTEQAGAESVLPAARTPAPGSVTLDLEHLSAEQQLGPLLDPLPLGAVLCVAGWTYVDGCESDPGRAMQINATGPAVLAAYAHSRGLPFVYYSTDYVFDGSEDDPGPYPETGKLNPINVYGRSKLAGEQEVQQAHPDALIVRTAGVYGFDRQGKNYLYTVLRALTKGASLNVPQDQVSTPAYNRDLARATYVLLRKGAHGMYHACGPEVFGRLELAEAMARFFGLPGDGLRGLNTASLGQPANRPLRAGLLSSKLAVEFPEAAMGTLEEGLTDCRARMLEAIQSWKTE